MTRAQPPDARDFYETSYSASSDMFRRWRGLGAGIKADHICELIKPIPAPRDVIEVGCGDGAVLAQLGRRGVGQRRVGIDIASAAVRLAAEQPEITEARVFDGARIDAGEDAFDLAICSHVLEHEADPQALLYEITRVAERAVVIEVPLERNLAARRGAARGLSQNAGHVHRFDRHGLRRLIAATGWRIQSELFDSLPAPVHTFGADTAAGVAQGYAKWAIRSALARQPWVAERLITLHYAVLATPAARTPS